MCANFMRLPYSGRTQSRIICYTCFSRFFKTIPLIMMFFLASLIFQDTEVFRHKNRFFVFSPEKPCFDVSECSFVIKCELNILSKKMTSRSLLRGSRDPGCQFYFHTARSMFDHLLKAVSPLNALSIIPGGRGHGSCCDCSLQDQIHRLNILCPLHFL